MDCKRQARQGHHATLFMPGAAPTDTHPGHPAGGHRARARFIHLSPLDKICARLKSSKYRPAVVVAALVLSACTTEGGGRMGLFSATAPVVAILYDDLFLGEAVGYMDRTGTITIQSAINPELRCVGEFRYTGSRTGVASLRCNDGVEAVMSFNGLSSLSGYGYGRTSRGPASFTYGLTPEEASKYLTLPPRKRIVRKPEGPRLEEV